MLVQKFYVECYIKVTLAFLISCKIFVVKDKIVSSKYKYSNK
jgi:hypothetical protein